MSFLFNGSTQYAQVATPIVTAVPLTFAAWIYPTTVNTVGEIICIAAADSVHYFTLRKNNASIEMVTRGAQTRTATSGATLVANTWYHVCAVTSAIDSRAAYVNGGNKGTNSQTTTPTVTGGQTSLARRGGTSATNYFPGRIAEAAIWNAALTDAEVAALAIGIEPSFIRHANLVAYLPLLCHSSAWNGTNESGNVIDVKRAGGWNISPASPNGPTSAEHARIIYGSRSRAVKPPITYQPGWSGFCIEQMFGGALVS